MTEEGQIILFPFPYTDQSAGKLRPALVLRRCPGAHNDWLICMISSQLHHELGGIDEVLRTTDADFDRTGLKLPSVIRITRLAVVADDLLQGAIGTIGEPRLTRIRQRLAQWLSSGNAQRGIAPR